MTETAPGIHQIHRAIAAQAAIQPTAAALVWRNRLISYAQLDSAASGYAARLAALGVRSGHVIPVIGPRSADLVVAQLAVLKCGAAYTNLDRRWPQERHAEILRQIDPVAVICDDTGVTDHCPVSPLLGEDLAVLASAGLHETADEAAEPGESAATVFFTSGTTGGPKGVIAPHLAITRLFGPGRLPGFGPGHVTPQASPSPWDMYAFELWGQLTTGGTVVIVEEDHLMPDTLRSLVKSDGVDTVWITTSLFNLFVDEDPDCFHGIQQVFTGGEKLSPRHVAEFLRQHPGIPLRNGYGPAENCMLTTTRLIRSEDCMVPEGIPVGSAVPGTQVLVLDEAGNQCPPGQVGEICMAGAGLANGYLGNPELTAEKFRRHAVNGHQVRAYHSGDLGVVDDDGVLHYRGRLDRQIKISGNRVELTEIELVARDIAGVRDAVVLPVTTRDGAVTRLVLCYLTAIAPDADTATGTARARDPLDVRKELQRRLPAYLVPSKVRAVERFPVTANGKLDRAELLHIVD